MSSRLPLPWREREGRSSKREEGGKGGGGEVFNPKGFIQPVGLKWVMRNKQDNKREVQGT